MNNIKEINAFYVKQETQALSMSVVSLWHALMHVNNRARWVKSFSVAASVVDELHEWAEQVGDTLVYAALVRTVGSDKKVWSYVRGILKNCLKHGLVMVEEVEAAEERFRRDRMRRYGGKNRTPREEFIPDWFKSRRSDVG